MSLAPRSASMLLKLNPLSAMEPVNKLDTNLTAPHGATPINPLKVVVFLYEENTSDWSVSKDGFWHLISVQSMMTLTSGQNCINFSGLVEFTSCLLIHTGKDPRIRNR